MRLFREEGFKVVVDPELKLVPEFRSILSRDRTVDKKQAMKELSYVYFAYDHKSPYYIYPIQERLLRVSKDTGLGENYEPDTKVVSAIRKYLELGKTPTIKSLTSIREGLLTSSRLIDTLRKRIEEALEDDDLEDIDPIVRSVTRMLEISEKLPKAIENITSLEEKILKEEASDVRIKGGGKKGMFED
jgi:predicted RNA binding protein with dsRBD fold (UPF0201 family)